MIGSQASVLCLMIFCCVCLQSVLMLLDTSGLCCVKQDQLQENFLVCKEPSSSVPHQFCLTQYKSKRLSYFVPNSLKIEVPSTVNLCDNATLLCRVRPGGSEVWWSAADVNITEDDRHMMERLEDNEIVLLKMTIICVSFEDIKNYTCHAAFSNDLADEIFDTVFLDISVLPAVIGTQFDRVKIDKPATLLCNFTGYPLDDFRWLKVGESLPLNQASVTKKWNETFFTSVLEFDAVGRKDNGTYHCTAVGPQGPVSADVPLFVLATPQVNIEFATAVGAHQIFLNWTVSDGNVPVEEYFIQHMKSGTNQWTYYPEHIGSGNSSYIVKNLESNSTYRLRLQAKNAIGMSNVGIYPTPVQTLETDPDFVPEISVKGVTSNSITIGWCQPPSSLKDHIHFYQLLIQNNDTGTKREAFHPASEMLLYLFVDLKPATTYHFKVAACSEYTRQCGNWSEEVNGTTMDGVSGPPENVTVVCHFDNVSSSSFVIVTWAPPRQPNGKIDRYNVTLIGEAIYKNERGELKNLDWDRKSTSVDEKSRSARFKFIPPNTNYTVRVAGVTRSRTSGEEATGHCQMPPTIPSRDKLAHFFWVKVKEQEHWIFKLLLPRISERNGPICCYRIFLVKLEPQQSVAELPAPEDFPVSSYEEVHRSKKGGAYIAEMFESDALNNEVFLGDGQNLQMNSSACLQCIGLRPVPPKTTTVPPSTGHTIQTNILLPTLGSGSANDISSASDPTIQPSPEPIQAIRTDALSAPRTVGELSVHDGHLDMNSNYTGFLEVIVYGVNRTLLPAYSDYFEQLNPGPEVTQAAESSQILAIVLQLLCALILLVLVLLVSLCLLQRYTKQVAQVQGVEMTLTNSFRHLCRSLRGRHILVSSSPPDMPPVSKGELTIAYLERHRDSDYGFQYEFELLPDRFPDRTTRNSEARENLYKNRYPDIKAYDQTRVRLSQIDSVVGSDYINANFVMGYKERKKFICAQGPMDNTVCDFWRMIWEQHLEMILMLTNLEEYSKTKCAKYWPDEAEGEKVFGDITLSHVQEKRYSDYIIRELKMCRAYAGTQEMRSIVQYHFLVWKDFMAPEHPSGILKFIKRVNEAYSLEKGPILVHCSAGVGRTGTLVALDSLLQQLQEEDQVAIFNTVCDLRHQRNFLVQSLKQYIFIYRALMEVAQFGDTELKVSELKGDIEKLRQRENGKDKSKMEEEFEKINRVLEDHKSFSVGRGDENQTKNRSELVIPYDRNRVILTPIPGREHSTYINASFIEGYDNSESFIITQDPLEMTIPDFWRMISEQGISTLVMLSDVGDGAKKCLRYWPDDEISHEHIHVKYIQSESCPYYTRREFSVTNTKTDENTLVTQFQYNGWPTVEGEVPEVTRGLIELVDQTQSHQESHGGSAPICVHCCYGSDRSSMFVALTILVQQLRTEKRVDIFTTTRKLRSQRHGMLQTFAQYEFLHRAIINYADLHHLADEDL